MGVKSFNKIILCSRCILKIQVLSQVIKNPSSILFFIWIIKNKHLKYEYTLETFSFLKLFFKINFLTRLQGWFHVLKNNLKDYIHLDFEQQSIKKRYF